MVEKKLWPACLPSTNLDYFGDRTYVAGWGITQTKLIHVSKAFISKGGGGCVGEWWLDLFW